MPDPSQPKAITIPQGRASLYQFLLDLPGPQFEAVLYDLELPKGNVPPSSAAQSDRVTALMTWLESPRIGPGIDALRASLDRVLNTPADLKNASAIAPFDLPNSSAERNIDIGQSVERSNLVSGDRNYIDQSRTVNHYYGLPDTRPAPTRTDRNERTLIDAVWTEVEDRLRQSLHNAILIRLDMAEQRSQVSRPWDSELRTADQKPKTLEPGTHIAEVFDRRDVGGKLLVLGHPGAGKTTTMLDLAATLVQRANGDPNEPIPVMVNLSSWQNAKQPFADWLVNELKLKYGVSQKLGQTWLSEKKLLPLLDGLDELPPARQEIAVQGINAWLQSDAGAPRLLVCSRLEEYELYASKLDLNGAICLSPLTDEQLKSYLASLKMAHLWDTLQHDDDLLTLVRTPLLLSVSILANDAIDLAQWGRLRNAQDRLDYLLDAYIMRRLHEPVKSKEYPPGKQPSTKQIRRWLVWLSMYLKRLSDDEFSFNKMQPGALLSRKEILCARVILSLVWGLILGVLFSLSFASSWIMAIAFSYPIVPIFSYLELSKWDLISKEIGTSITVWIKLGFGLGVFCSLIGILSNYPKNLEDLINTKIHEQKKLQFNPLVESLIRFLRKVNSERKKIVLECAISSFAVLRSTFPLVVIFSILSSLNRFFPVEIINSIAILSILDRQAELFQDLNWMSFLLRILVDFTHNIFISSLTILILVLFGLIGLKVAGAFFSAWLVEVNRIDSPGRSIKGFGRNSLLILLGTLSCAPIIYWKISDRMGSYLNKLYLAVARIEALNRLDCTSNEDFSLYLLCQDLLDSTHTDLTLYSLSQDVVEAATEIMFPAFIISVCGIVLFSIFGGDLYLRYQTLFWILIFNSKLSRRSLRFLNHCTDRLLLQRVGDRYRFIHRLVQEHFAAMPLDR